MHRWDIIETAALLAALFGAAPGCGDDSSTGPTTTTTGTEPLGGGAPGCSPGELELDDGSCLPAGVPADLPPPGPTEPVEAGIPADQCADGFEPTGDSGCNPILPSTPCSPGTMAVPGDATCHEIAPCGDGTWGDIPIESSTQHVDQAHAGASDGSSTSPWTTIQQAVDAADPGAIVAVAAGVYAEDVLISGQAVRLWGRCPQMVDLHGLAADHALVVVDAPGTELRQLAVTGPATAIRVTSSDDVLIDRLWIHDPGRSAALIEAAVGVEVSASLIEGPLRFGLLVHSSQVRIDRTAIRDVGPWPDTMDLGRSLAVQADLDTGQRADATVQGCLIERSYEIGVVVAGSDLTMHGSVVRDTTRQAGDPVDGLGLIVMEGAGGRGLATISGSVVERHGSSAVYIRGSTVSMDTTVVRETTAGDDGWRGCGLWVEPQGGDSPDGRAHLTVRRSLIEQNHDAGILVRSSDALLERVIIRDTQSQHATGGGGEGLYVTARDMAMGSSMVQVRASVFERNHGAGALSLGSELLVEDSILRDTLPPDDQSMATGLASIGDVDLGLAGVAILRSSLVEGTAGLGAFAQDAPLTVQSTIVRDTTARASDGELGEGLGVATYADELPATLAISGSRIERSQEAGVGAQGSDLVIERTTIRDTESRQSDGEFGRGVRLEPGYSGRRSVAVLRLSSIERHRESGVFVWSSDLQMEGTIVRDVQPAVAAHAAGSGVTISDGPDSSDPSRVAIVGSVIDHTHLGGVLVDGSQAILDSSILRAPASRPLDGRFGRCIMAQAGATVDLLDSTLEQCREAGVYAIDSTVRISGSSITELMPSDSDGTLGDGVVVVAHGVQTTSVLVDRTRIANAPRVGIANFGALVTLSNTSLDCNPIDLDAELSTWPARFDDLGGNVCGCAGQTFPCAVQSTNLAPPEPPP